MLNFYCWMKLFEVRRLEINICKKFYYWDILWNKNIQEVSHMHVQLSVTAVIASTASFSGNDSNIT